MHGILLRELNGNVDMEQNKYDEKQQRLQDYQEQYRRLQAEGYTAKDCTISVLRANVMAFVTAGPFVVIAVALYLSKWAGDTFSLTANLPGMLLFLAMLAVSIPMHEGLHGAAWSLVAKNGWRSIRFGVMRPSYTPYCHCKEPLGFFGYLFGALMPFAVLGVGTLVIAYLTGSAFFLAASAINLLAAGGDTTLVLMMLPYTKAQFLDHPFACGFTAFTKAGL